MKLDHNNGKVVTGITAESITFDDGTTVDQLMSLPPAEIVGTKLLKVPEEEGVAYLTFGHSFADGREPLVVAVVEATGDDLRAEDG